MEKTLVEDFLKSRLPFYLSSLKKMVETNSHTRNPQGVAENAQLCVELFSPLGFAASYRPCEDARYGSHLFLSRPGKGSCSVLLVSHLDTVFSQREEQENNFHWREEGERIYGPGTIDIKGGTLLASMLLEVMKEFSPQIFEEVEWVVALNAAEEVGVPDFPEVLRTFSRKEVKACLVFEAGSYQNGEFQLVTSRKGRFQFEIEIEGRSAHSGMVHERGANAGRELARMVEKIESLTDYEKTLTANVGVIRAGESFNRVPHKAWASGEVRTFSPEALSQTEHLLREMANQGTIKSPFDGYPCTIAVTVENHMPAWPTGEGTSRLWRAWSEAAKSLHYSVQEEARGGLSDANRLWHAFPTIDGLGPSGDNDHCSERSANGEKDQEYLDSRSLLPKTMLNAFALERFLSQ